MTRVLSLLLVLIITFSCIGLLVMSHMHNSNLNGGGNTENGGNQSGSNTGNGGGDTEGGNTDTDGENGNDENKATTIRIGYMAGPTGMGMAKLVSDNGGLDGNSDKYSFTKYTDTTMAKADLAAGKIDVICLPTNEAAMYYSKVDSEAKVLAINCLNSLYYVQGLEIFGKPNMTLKDLEGKTVYTCKNGTPRMILEYIIKEQGLNIEVSYTVDGKEIITPADLSALAIAGKIPNAVMPEPLVTSVVLGTQKNEVLSRIFEVKIDLSTEWEKISDTPIAMGCIVTNGDFAEANGELIDAFLDEYKASVDYIRNPVNIDSAANYVVETGVMAAAPAAKKSLLNLGSSICYLDGEDMKSTLEAFYGALKIALPGDEFYYEK